jgi:hypothetical protein
MFEATGIVNWTSGCIRAESYGFTCHTLLNSNKEGYKESHDFNLIITLETGILCSNAPLVQVGPRQRPHASPTSVEE